MTTLPASPCPKRSREAGRVVTRCWDPMPRYVSLWFGLLTARLPLHRQLLDIGSDPAVGCLGVDHRVGGRAVPTSPVWARSAALMVLIASPTALGVFMAPVAHNTTYPYVAPLCAHFVWSGADPQTRWGRAQSYRLGGGSPPVVLGARRVSDLLLLPTGVVPFSLAAAHRMAARRSTRKAARSLRICDR